MWLLIGMTSLEVAVTVLSVALLLLSPGAWRHVLWMPCRGRAICSFAVAGLGFRYFVLPCRVRFGHPLRYPCLMAFRSVAIVGLQSAWCANQMLLAQVLTVCAKAAIGVCGEVSPMAAAVSVLCGYLWEVLLGNPNESVHRSVTGSLVPRRMTCPSYQTTHSPFMKVTLHPASVSTRMPKRDAMDKLGMMCPVRTVGRPSIAMSHMCVDMTWHPSANATFRGRGVGHLLTTGVPSMTKIWVAPESAMGWFVWLCIAPPAMSMGGSVDTLEITMVILSLSYCGVQLLREKNWRVGYDVFVVLP